MSLLQLVLRCMKRCGRVNIDMLKFFYKRLQKLPGSGYRNPALAGESTILTPGGRGNAGTTAFYFSAMAEKIREVEEQLREAYAFGKSGAEQEVCDQESKTKGRGLRH